MNKKTLFTILATLGLLAGVFSPVAVAKSQPEGKNSKAVDFRLAAQVGDEEVIEKLLKQGVNVDTGNKFGKTALMMAVENGNEETVIVLLKAGANVNAKTVAGCTALTFSCSDIRKSECHSCNQQRTEYGFHDHVLVSFLFFSLTNFTLLKCFLFFAGLYH